MKTLSLAFAMGATVACGAVDGMDDPMTPDPARPSAEGCVAPTGEGTNHQGEINASETWTAAASPHVVTFNVYVRAGTLTIEPCAVVRIQEGYLISVDGRTETATLRAHGEMIINDDGSTTVRPVVFMPDAPGTFWGALLVRPTGLLDLEHVELRNGGSHLAAPDLGGTVVAGGSGGPELTRNVRAVSVLIEGSEGFGVNLQGAAAFTADSRDLTIRGSGQRPSITNVITDYPLFIVPPALQTIPTGAYTGNAIDGVFVLNPGNITVDERFKDVGVPYRIGGNFAMGPLGTAADGDLVTLTIEAGVRIEMEQDASFNLGTSNGALPENIWPVRLVADGESDAPIVFTSASAAPNAGDWGGIEWHGGASAENVMRNVRIEYAGGDSGTRGFGCGPADNDAGLIFRNWRPDEDFIDGLTIAESASGGVVSGWTSDDPGPNFKEGNTFINVGNGCDVSRWADASSPSCPGADDVPDCL